MNIPHYERYSDRWVEEMMELDKETIVKMLRTKGQALDRTVMCCDELQKSHTMVCGQKAELVEALETIGKVAVSKGFYDKICRAILATTQAALKSVRVDNKISEREIEEVLREDGLEREHQKRMGGG